MTRIALAAKPTLREYYDLKKMYERISIVLAELEIEETQLQQGRADLQRIYDEGFMKVDMEGEQKIVGYYRGGIKEGQA